MVTVVRSGQAGADASSPPPPPRARSAKGARTRARLVEAAREVFAEQGLPDARIADIAERAGVGYGSFYHYFESKEVLFREIASEVDEQLRAPVEEIILDRDVAATPGDRIRRAIRRHYETYRAEARLLGVIEQAARIDEPVRAAREARHREDNRTVAESIRSLQRRGLADAALDPAIAAAALGAMTYRFGELWLAHGDIDCEFETALDTVTRLFVNALGLETGRSQRDGDPAS